MKIIIDNIKYIPYGIFSDNDEIEEIEIRNAEEIGRLAFSRCRKLKKIIIGNQVRFIDSYAFLQCESLQEIHIPPNVKFICRKAFFGCIYLKYIYKTRATHLEREGLHPYTTIVETD